MSNTTNRRISQIVIDRKIDCGDLRKRFGKKWWSHFYLRAENFAFGLQPPAGVSAQEWIQAICCSIAARGNLISSAISLSIMMQWLVAVMNQNRSPGNPILFPDFRLMYGIAKRSSWKLWGSKDEYVKTLIQMLHAVSYLCPFLRAFNGLDLDRDIISKGKSCVIEIPTVYPSWIRLFIVDLIALQILYGRIHRRAKASQTEVIVYLDEADQDVTNLASDAAFPDGFSPLAQLLRYGREFGISVVVGLGVLGHVSKFVSSSFQYTFMFDLSEGEQIANAKRTLLLPPRAEEMLPALKPGECIFRESQGAWAHPVWCKIDYVPPDRETSGIEYDTHFLIPSKPLSELPVVEQALREYVAEAKRNDLRQANLPGGNATRISKHSHNLIHAMATHPWAPAKELWKATGQTPTPAVQKAVRRELAEAGLALSELIRPGSANVLLYQLQEEGWHSIGREPPIRTGGPSIAHQHISRWIAMAEHQEGSETSCEWLAGNHRADCAKNIGNGLWDAYEVVVKCSSNLVSHLTALSQCANVRNIIIVCLQKKIIEQIQGQIGSESVVKALGDRLQWELAETYLRRLWP